MKASADLIPPPQPVMRVCIPHIEICKPDPQAIALPRGESFIVLLMGREQARELHAALSLHFD